MAYIYACVFCCHTGVKLTGAWGWWTFAHTADPVTKAKCYEEIGQFKAGPPVEECWNKRQSGPVLFQIKRVDK